jgi:metal transporter CNNM
MELSKWIGIVICLMHSAMFSGLNLGFFGLSRLRLVVKAEDGDKDAQRILSLRKDAHLLLATLLWGNVASNVLLALIADSILTGLWAFLISTFGITFFGEIFPQAFFVKHALKTSFVLVPIVRFYQTVLYPFAKPAALLLDRFLGKEEIIYFQEREIKILLERHVRSKLTDLELLETLGAVNFLAIDDIKIEEEGEIINPRSIIPLPLTAKGLPRFPKFVREFDDPFLQKVHASQEKWVIITDPLDYPALVLNADQFLRDAMYGKEVKSIYMYCHRPIVVTEAGTKLGEVILKFKVRPEYAEDNVIDNDIILYWNHEKRIITGADILGRLLQGIVNVPYPKKEDNKEEATK